MLYATELMGAKTYDAQGNYVGKIREFFIEPADQPESHRALFAVAGEFSAAGGEARPSGVGGARECAAERQRAVAGTLRTE